MIARSTLFAARGGDTVQAMQTARLLQEWGVETDIKLTHEPIDYHQYQLLHFFNITRPADILFHIRKTNLPFVISTVLINYSEYDKNHRGGLPGCIFRFLEADSIEYIKTIARWIRQKDRLVSTSFLWKGQHRSIRQVLKKASLLLPNSISEYRRLRSRYGIEGQYMVVPNAVDEQLFRYNPQIKKENDLVLCVARIEGIKNQLQLIKAVNHSRYRLIIIGAPAPNQLSYYQECRNAAAANISFIEQLPQEALVAWYQRAKVHVLPSWFETTGLSSLEAAAMRCNIVITDKGDTREYFGEDAFYCDPASPQSILAAIEKASTLPANETLQTKILAQYTWRQASRRTAEGYKKIIQQPWH